MLIENCQEKCYKNQLGRGQTNKSLLLSILYNQSCKIVTTPSLMGVYRNGLAP